MWAWCVLFSSQIPFSLFISNGIIIGFVWNCRRCRHRRHIQRDKREEMVEQKSLPLSCKLVYSESEMSNDNRNTFQSFTFSMNFYELRTSYLAVECRLHRLWLPQIRFWVSGTIVTGHVEQFKKNRTRDKKPSPHASRSDSKSSFFLRPIDRLLRNNRAHWQILFVRCNYHKIKLMHKLYVQSLEIVLVYHCVWMRHGHHWKHGLVLTFHLDHTVEATC